MELSGNQEFNAPPEEIWNLLMDVDTLVRITPGISELVLIEDNKYKAVSAIKIGPVNGKFEGQLELVDKFEPNSFQINVIQESKIGNVDAEVKISLKEVNGQKTKISFDGMAKISGLLARTGQRVLHGVANTIEKQFFEALAKEISKS